MISEKIKKIPERRCVGCGKSFAKKDLIRVVRNMEGNISIDFTGRKAGRGAYICRNTQCFAKAQKAKRFESNLDCAIPLEVYERLAAELRENESK